MSTSEGIYDRDPLPAWTSGTVTLVGDAAHPMMPTLAQGAAITLEDSCAVARHLDGQRDDPAAALKSYEAERLPRARCDNCRRGCSSRTTARSRRRRRSAGTGSSSTTPPWDRRSRRRLPRFWLTRGHGVINLPPHRPVRLRA